MPKYATYFNHRANDDAFTGALASPFNNIVTPDAADRVARHRTHVLIDIHQGVLGGVMDSPDIMEMFKDLRMPVAGANLDDFKFRMDVLAKLSSFLSTRFPVSLVHWTQSNMLVPGERFASLAEGDNHPGFLTVHPRLFGCDPMPGFEERPVEILTHGAADYIGREVYLAPAPIPWPEHLNAAMVLIKVALMENGYLIPDGHTFGSEDNDSSYLVEYLDAADHPLGQNEPTYRLTLRYSEKFGYTTVEHEAREKVPGGLVEIDEEAAGDPEFGEQVKIMQSEDEMARKAGIKFDIYRRNTPEPAQGGYTSSYGRFGAKRAVFGRKH